MTGSIASMVGVVFSMISIRLMMIVEGAQVVVIGTIGQQLHPGRIVAMAIGTHKFFVINLSIVFLSRISYLIFWAEGMYPERLVHTAALGMMNTVVISGKTKIQAAALHTKRAAKSVRSNVSKAKHYGKSTTNRVRRGKYYAAPVRL
jgi:hypothetical protein